MKKGVLLSVMITMSTFLMSQNVEIEGKAKITVMDPATSSAKQVARELDGTLSLMTSYKPTYEIGDFAQGGVVFWVSPSGAHCKVVSIYNVGVVRWSNMSTVVGSAGRSEINGAGNTVALMMQSGHTDSAAQHCADLGYGGYDDWFLPSKDELNKMYNNKVAINAKAIANGGEVFVDDYYWSSTEEIGGDALQQDFATGTQGGDDKSGSTGNVRAIRAF